MPVWVGGQCFIGRLIDWFGGYSRKDGLFAQLRVRSLKGDDEQTYAVHGLRTAIAGGTKTSVGKVEGDNGM